ncbi:MAG TPA: N-formylglutamate amidohydrolase [Rhodospirillales bacterium]|nr:N-formylglutamate amidohydrolase [Rhodospirillales bacterium]
MTVPDDSTQRAFVATETDDNRSPVPPWRLLAPAEQTAPVVFASPHSGRDYPPEFIAASRLNVVSLRRSEDAFMDEIFAAAPDFGAPLLCARFPRAYVDANREAFELDPAMFTDPLPDYVNTRSPRIAAGLGTIARVVTDGEDIYHEPLRFEDALGRIEALYRPYHKALQGLLQATQERFGGCLLVDCHSMPSGQLAPELGAGDGNKPADMVLGDCFGTSSAPVVTDIAKAALEASGFTVALNKPYAGGFTTHHYGRPREGVHVLQVEINRALYMDEKLVRRGPGLPALKCRLGPLMRALANIDPAILKAP